MKVLQINSVVKKGSTGHIVENIGKFLILDNHNSFIAYGRYQEKSNSYLYKIGNKVTVFFHGLLSRFFDLHGRGSRFSTFLFLKWVKEMNPDIIHLHNIHGYYLNFCLLFKYLQSKNIPIVWTFHDCWAFTGHCAYYSFKNCKKWIKEDCKGCLNKKTYPSCYFLSNSKNNYKKKKKYFTTLENLTIVTPSEWLQNEVKKSFFKQNPCIVINNGIDLSIFYPRAKKNLFGKHVILGVANIWEKRKGFDDFINLSEIISEDYVIVLIGVSDKQEKLLKKNMIGIKRTANQDELAEYYSEALCFVNPTYEDNFPTTNIEAIACGTPIITYNTGGSSEIIDSETGYVVEQGNVHEIYKKIKEIELKGKVNYIKQCTNRAKKMYNKDDKFEEYINLYNDLLNEAKDKGIN